MMMQQVNYSRQMKHATAGIFGAYVSAMITVSGREKTAEQRRRDRERQESRFEMIEDYIEQA